MHRDFQKSVHSTWINTWANRNRIHKVPSSNCNHRLVYLRHKLRISFWQYRVRYVRVCTCSLLHNWVRYLYHNPVRYLYPVEKLKTCVGEVVVPFTRHNFVQRSVAWYRRDARQLIRITLQLHVALQAKWLIPLDVVAWKLSLFL